MFIWIILTISLLAGASPKQSPCSKAFSESHSQKKISLQGISKFLTNKFFQTQTEEQKLYKKTGNPLFDLTKASKDLVDFKSIKDEHFTEAMEFYNEKILSQIEHIENLPANFHNTIEPLDNMVKEIDYIYRILNTLRLIRDVSDIQKDIRFFTPLSSTVLFQKVESVYKDTKLKETLSLEQAYLLKKTYKEFKERQALNSSQQKTANKVEEQIAQLTANFIDNTFAENTEHKIFVDKEEDLKGIPEDTIKVMRQFAIDDGKPDKWLITLSNPRVYSDVMDYAENRNLRKRVYESIQFLNYKGKYDNSKIIAEQIKLKNRIAKMHGYSNASSYILKDNMLNTPEKVFDFLHSVENKLEPFLFNRFKNIKDFSKLDDFQRSDLAFYYTKYTQEKFNFDLEDMKPYFTYNNTIKGMFMLANKMFGLSFKDVTKENKHSQYHEDVSIYAVYDQGTHIGTLYVDPYTREEKLKLPHEAAVTSILSSGNLNGKVIKPQISLFANFIKDFSLLDANEVTILFHEFGHALHFLLSKNKYHSNDSQSIETDAVEIPSTLMENLAFHPEVLPLYAKHYKTGKPIPQELVDKYKQKQSYDKFFQALETTTSSLLDMHIHTSNPNSLKDIKKFEKKIISKKRKEIGNSIFRCKNRPVQSCSLSPMFSEGYSSQVYSYLWSDVLASDILATLDEKGIFNKEFNNKFKKFLQAGSSQPAEVLYKDLMGRSVDVNHFIERFDQNLD